MGKVQLTKFGERHFNRGFNGTKIFSHSPREFESVISNCVKAIDDGLTIPEGPFTMGDEVKLLDGYADFCKLLVVPNFTDAKTGTLPITLENFQYLRSGYFSRTEKELPVLSRWFEIPRQFVPKAEYLVVVLYTYDQLLVEHRSKSDDNIDPLELDDNTDWGVVAILGQMSDTEEPMKPITMLRNALGKEEGGSGHPLDREKYLESVEFWKNNATVK